METITIDTGQIQEVESQTDIIVADSRKIVIQNNEQYESASAFLKDVKTKTKELDTLRKSITSPLDTSKKKIMDLFRNPLDKLKSVESTIKKSMISYSNEQERKQREIQAKLQREADEKARKERERLEARAKLWEEKGKTEKAEELLEKAEEVVPESPVVIAMPEKPKGVSYSQKWSAEVVDIDKVPREYMIANMDALNGIARSTKGTIQIPGVEFHSEKILSSRAG